jgi:CHRD domain-containing protein
MRHAMIRAGLSFTIAAGMMLLTGPTSFAASVKYRADMKGSKEVPPTNSSGSGKANITYDTKSKKLSWVVTYSGLSGEPTAAHFHGPAAPGKSAGPVVDISGDIKKGSAELTPDQAADLGAGKWYLNIHTEKFPDGEIRGQVVK